MRLCVLTFTLALSAQAQSAAAVRAELEAPEGCPDADWFLQQILKRAPGARAADAAEPARRFRASVRREDAGFSGVVDSESLARTAGSSARGRSCEEVITALAVTVALSLDADPIEAAAPAPEPSPSPKIAESPQPEQVAAPERAFGAEAQREPWLWGVSVEASALGVGVPLMLGGNVSVLWRASQPGAWAPMLRLGGGFLTQPRERDISLQMPVAIVAVCPSLLELGPLWLTPCANTLVGLLRGEAQPPRAAEPARLLFGGSGVEARLEWLSEPVLVGVRASVLGVWSAPTFRSQPSGTALLEVERVAVDAGVGLGLVF